MCRVLLIEDSVVQHHVVAAKLRKLDVQIDLVIAETLSAAKDWLSTHCEYEIVILDLGLPDSAGVATFVEIKAHCPGIPVIVYTAEDDFEVALECIKLGAETVLLKPDVEPLPRAVAFVLEKQKMRRKMEEALRAQMQQITCGMAKDLEQAKQTLIETADQLGMATQEKREWAKTGTAQICG